MEMKSCRECGRELPRNTDYYFKKKDTEDGFTNKCKECQGYSFTNKLTKIPKEGCKFCVKCDRELPSTYIYFPMDDMCKDGLRNVCRECGKDGHFMKEDYIPKRVWTDEENKIFIERYPHYTNEEIVDFFYQSETLKDVHDRAYRLGCTNTKTQATLDRINTSRSKKMSGVNSPYWGIPKPYSVRKKISLANKEYYKNNPHPAKGRVASPETRKKLSKRMKGKWSGDKNPRYLNPLFGKDNPNWKGGRTPLYFELRSETRQWQLDSMKNCNYKCTVTKGEFNHVHHLYPFRKIIDEVFENLKLNQRLTVSGYTELEFNKIKDEMHRLHKEYGYGVCLRKDVHKLFHDLYGYTNNTPKQFDEFRVRYRIGEFDKVLNKNIKHVM